MKQREKLQQPGIVEQATRLYHLLSSSTAGALPVWVSEFLSDREVILGAVTGAHTYLSDLCLYDCIEHPF